MDGQLLALNHRVAEAAEAWLTDPLDSGVYNRLVSATLARRAYRNPQLDLSVPDEQALHILDELVAGPAPARLGELIAALPLHPPAAGSAG